MRFRGPHDQFSPLSHFVHTQFEQSHGSRTAKVPLYPNDKTARPPPVFGLRPPANGDRQVCVGAAATATAFLALLANKYSADKREKSALFTLKDTGGVVIWQMNA